MIGIVEVILIIPLSLALAALIKYCSSTLTEDWLRNRDKQAKGERVNVGPRAKVILIFLGVMVATTIILTIIDAWR